MRFSTPVVIALVLAAAAPCYGLAELPHRARGGLAWKLRSERATLSAAPAKYFTQNLTHDGASTATFQQRYFVDTTFWDGQSGPVFVNICGEGPCSAPSTTDVIANLAKQHGGCLVSLEHRFYGDSVPNKDMSTSNLKHLTVANALADINAFIQALPTLIPVKSSGTPLKVFTVGGSYSGALSAWFREKYPDTVFGSLSSSGVVHAIKAFTEFDLQVSVSAGPTCAASLKAITAAFEAAFDSGKQAEAMALFNAPSTMSKPDFFYMIADSAAMGVQYGNMVELCSSLPDASAPAETLRAALANITTVLWGPNFAADCFYDTQCLKNQPSKWQPTSRAWRWQKCNELAYFQVAPPVGQSIRSQVVDMEYHLEQCAEAFGIAGMQPDTAAFNAKYGGATPSETNVFYSNGSQDPWQRAAVNHTLSPTQPEVTAECDSCGHCGDLESYAKSDAVNQQRAEFTKVFNTWWSAL